MFHDGLVRDVGTAWRKRKWDVNSWRGEVERLRTNRSVIHRNIYTTTTPWVFNPNLRCADLLRKFSSIASQVTSMTISLHLHEVALIYVAISMADRRRATLSGALRPTKHSSQAIKYTLSVSFLSLFYIATAKLCCQSSKATTPTPLHKANRWLWIQPVLTTWAST